MKIDTLGKKVGLGYALMVLLLAFAVLITIWQVRNTNDTAERLINLREPTAKSSLQVLNGVNHAVAALRGWILLPEQSFEDDFLQAWEQEIRAPLNRLQQLSADWTSPENVLRLSRMVSLVEQLETYHTQVKTLAVTDRDAANKLLNDKTFPLSREIREVLNEMLDDQDILLQSDFSEMNRQITLLRIIEWGLLVLGVSLSIVLSLLVARAVTRPISGAVTIANEIAAGNLDTDVNLTGSREVKMLGSALTDMRDSLKAKTLETEKYVWLTNGQNRLNQIMRGDQGIDELATSIITFMSTYTQANIGSLYLVSENSGTFSLAGRYAYDAVSARDSFNLGEGLIGQAAADKTPILLQELDEHYIRVQSSLLDTPPRNIYLAPFLLDGRTLGVLELGKLNDFDEANQEFVQSNLEAVSIVLNSAIARKKIQELLEETQRQSEELQQQQEELEQTNEELEEQTQQLRDQQEELQAANEELEEQSQAVSQQNSELEAARSNLEFKTRELEISSKYKSEFLANMSHELRTPLNSLLILSNDLARNADNNLNGEQVESAQVISRSGHDLLSLINDILDLSKIEAGKMSLNVTGVTLADIADDIRRTFGRQAAEKSLTLDTVIDETLPDTIRTDKQRLEQILRNLIANALKFTEKGSVKISFQREPNNQIAIVVADTGIGIPKDKQALVFEAFLQLESGTARKYGGTGLGLSICRDLAKLLGGTITVDSEEGIGSSFTLVIPESIETDMYATPEPVRQPKQVAPQPDRHRFLDYPTIPDQREDIASDDHTILIIEDDDDFARVLAEQAKKKGFKHLNAATGEDGLALAASYQPHAIILDLALPGMDGYLVLKELKSDPQLRHIPVHIMSAEEKQLDPIKAGAVDYLAKPIDKQQLDASFARMEDFINRKMKNLLIIEDNKMQRKAIVKLIGNGDVQCLEASTAQEALKILREQTVDCLVLDVGLPDMSGFELIKELENSSGTMDGRVPPIIVYTGKELTRQENEELQQYAETIIIKGVKSEERLLDETALFLHRTLSNLPPQKQGIITAMYDKEAQLQGKQILLVDDDMRNIFALSKVLSERGMKVIKADNGRVALDLLANNPDMDFVLMDIMMPEMDGYECIRKIRQQNHLQDLPIVALTAKAMKEDRQKCIDAGANDYIAKPVEVERLFSLMRIWMRK
ncbi:response regulator [Methylophaga sp. OBS4]|uniref:response regulator n=1 Tax=Methylophaga sp. OBS4 TaxID=2991935 RepID=UPI00225B3BAC|nr:response regulator [Methylophaga sp. OBS4]MCX4187110.1 response regulator [Methylophaga sp. OBS4]